MLNEYFQNKLDEAYELIQNDTELALNIFNELLEQEPENIEVLNGKGSALMKLNKIDEADECFNQSILVSENPSALINKGLISKQRNEYSKALKYYDSAIQLDSNLNNIVSILKNEIMDLIDDTILSIDEFAPEANECIKAGIDFKNEGQIWDALDCFNKALECDPACENSVLILIDEIKNILYNRFLFNVLEFNDSEIDDLKLKFLKALLIEEDYNKALKFMEDILDVYGDDVDTLNYKGCVLFLFDKYDESIECFDKCLSIDEEYYYALFNKGIVLRKACRLKESFSCFNKLLKIPEYEETVKEYILEIIEKINGQI